ncbi:hypothetical protein bpr_I2438 [Butyrivibrio proteoclasticus B316]|uniref:Uncharacterized protein n=1 Tax=Butyrivibrio proteoclasticus (strain ATCC 51982 / DSM 14932 / B316) TaxID=515622 RepID=E0RZQ5_BUTPB|nr:hypothetical protein [Butyrivibrio proteoclasticus]ADL35171.1 hypothetical protein bpr_I2438 [Butyrivibrio proteoclasticus B316]
MVSDNSYVECLVSSKASPVMVFLKGASLTLAVISFLSSILMGTGIVGMILAIAFGAGYYFASLNASIEFEYQYCDREITVDKVLNKERRKNIGKYDVGKIEAMAPSRSYHLDEYKNRTYKVLDFSAREKDPQPDPTYTIYYDGKEKIILEPTKEFVDAVKNVAPRKVFVD